MKNFLDSLTNIHFEKDAGGKVMFLPWGKLAGCYILESEEKLLRIKRFMRCAVVLWLLFAIILFVLGDAFLSLFLTVGACVLYDLIVRLYLKKIGIFLPRKARKDICD